MRQRQNSAAPHPPTRVCLSLLMISPRLIRLKRAGVPACHKGHALALGQSAYTSLQRASMAAANTPFDKHALYEILVFLPKCLLLKRQSINEARIYRRLSSSSLIIRFGEQMPGKNTGLSQGSKAVMFRPQPFRNEFLSHLISTSQTKIGL